MPTDPNQPITVPTQTANPAPVPGPLVPVTPSQFTSGSGDPTRATTVVPSVPGPYAGASYGPYQTPYPTAYGGVQGGYRPQGGYPTPQGPLQQGGGGALAAPRSAADTDAAIRNYAVSLGIDPSIAGRISRVNGTWQYFDSNASRWIPVQGADKLNAFQQQIEGGQAGQAGGGGVHDQRQGYASSAGGLGPWLTPGSENYGLTDAQRYAQPNPANFQAPQYDWRQQNFVNLMRGTEGRTAPQLGQANLAVNNSQFGAGQGGLAGYLGQYMQGQGLAAGDERMQAQNLAALLSGTGGPIGLGASQFRGGQQGVADILSQQAYGGRSLAAEQVQAAEQRAIADQQAAAASARPGQGAGAALIAAQNIGGLQSAGATAEGQARLQEQQQAAGTLAGVLQGARGQDVAQLEANRQAQMAALQGAGQLQQGVAGLGLQAAGLQQQGQLGAAGTLANVLQSGRASDIQLALANQQAQNQFAMANPQLQLQSQAQNDQFLQQLLGLEQQQAGMQLQGQMGFENQLGGRFANILGQPRQPSAWDYIAGIGGAVLGGLPALLTGGK